MTTVAAKACRTGPWSVLHTGAVTLTAAVRRRLRERTSLPRDVLVLGLIAFCVAVGFGVLVQVMGGGTFFIAAGMCLIAAGLTLLSLRLMPTHAQAPSPNIAH